MHLVPRLMARMGFVHPAAIAMLLCLVHASDLSKSKYGLLLPRVSKIAFDPVYRIAIQDTNAAPFDALLQIIASATTGWAGFAYGAVP